jgi:hypothetical protein
MKCMCRQSDVEKHVRGVSYVTLGYERVKILSKTLLHHFEMCLNISAQIFRSCSETIL